MLSTSGSFLWKQRWRAALPFATHHAVRHLGLSHPLQAHEFSDSVALAQVLRVTVQNGPQSLAIVIGPRNAVLVFGRLLEVVATIHSANGGQIPFLTSISVVLYNVKSGGSREERGVGALSAPAKCEACIVAAKAKRLADGNLDFAVDGVTFSDKIEVADRVVQVCAHMRAALAYAQRGDRRF